MDATQGADHQAKSAPRAVARMARTALSTSTNWKRRKRPAPMEMRRAISWERAAVWAVKEIGDVDAGNQEDEPDQHSEDYERPAVFLLRLGSAGCGGMQAEAAFQIRLEEGPERVRWRLRLLKVFTQVGAEDGLQAVADRLGVAGQRTDPDAEPLPVAFVNGRGIHHGGSEEIGDGSGFRPGEIPGTHADDLIQLAVHMKRTADHFRVAAEAGTPIVVRENRDWIGAGLLIVGGLRRRPRAGVRPSAEKAVPETYCR